MSDSAVIQKKPEKRFQFFPFLTCDRPKISSFENSKFPKKKYDQHVNSVIWKKLKYFSMFMIMTGIIHKRTSNEQKYDIND